MDDRCKVLIVDDDELVLEVIRDQLHRLYNCRAEADPRLALLRLEEEAADIVISDQVMPGMYGHQLLTEVARRWPETERILVTGYSDMESTIKTVNGGRICHYLGKPWQPGQLHQAVSEAAERCRLRRETQQEHLQACQRLEQGRRFLKAFLYRGGPSSGRCARAQSQGEMHLLEPSE